MKFQRLASTIAAVAIAGGGAITMSAVTTPSAYADGGGSFGHDGFDDGFGRDFGRGFSRHGSHHNAFGEAFGFAGGANVCEARSVKRYVKKRGGGAFGRYFGGHRRHVVKKVAKRFVRCASAHRRAQAVRHHNRHDRFRHHNRHHRFGHDGFDHKRFGHKDFDHKGFGHKGGNWDW